MKKRIFCGVLAATSLAGCASTPPVVVNYFLPRADAKVTLISSVACDAAQQNVFVADTVTSAIAYSADPREQHAVTIRDLDSPLANTDVGFAFADDGQRLSGVNVSQTGQGTQVIDSLISLAGVALAAAQGDSDDPAIKRACEYIESVNPKDKVLTITFVASEPFNTIHGPTPIDAIAQDADRYDNVKVALGERCLGLALVEPKATVPVSYSRGSRNDVQLRLRQPARVKLTVSRDRLGNGCSQASKPVWEGIAMVPQSGISYDLPIPRAAFIGKQTLSLKLSDAGAVTQIGYGNESGATATIGSVGKMLDLLDGQTDAQRAAELDAQADLIAQQQRLLKCRADPTTCPT